MNGGIVSRDYRVDGCNVTAGVKDGSVRSLSLKLTTKCNFSLAAILGGSTPTRTMQIAQFDEIACAVAAFCGDLRKADPEASFTISVNVAKRQRKPRGFDAADKANAFGQNAFLRSDVGVDALHRKLTLPIVAAAA